MPEPTGCATCDGTAACPHCWHGVAVADRGLLRCCRCDAETYPEPVPGYRDTWSTPPTDAFRRTDGERPS